MFLLKLQWPKKKFLLYCIISRIFVFTVSRNSGTKYCDFMHPLLRNILKTSSLIYIFLFLIYPPTPRLFWLVYTECPFPYSFTRINLPIHFFKGLATESCLRHYVTCLALDGKNSSRLQSARVELNRPSFEREKRKRTRKSMFIAPFPPIR